MPSLRKRILIATGEASGDQHAAELVKALQQCTDNLELSGIGGQNMAKAGVNILFDANQLAVVGVVEVLSHLGAIWQAFKIIKKTIKNNPPDVLICVDNPGFNLRIAKIAHKAGIKVFYYISPQLWAWKKGRIKIIKKYVDQMAVILPFEEAFYQQAGVKATFVGHPSATTVQANMTRRQACQHFKLNPQHKIIGLVPGSRLGELKHLLPTILQSAQQLAQRYPQAQFVLPIAQTLTPEDFKPYLKRYPVDIHCYPTDRYELLNCCDAIIATSGTVTLEIALLQKPLVIIYKISPLTFWIGKRIVKFDYFGLCNIIAKEAVVKELLQDQANPENIVKEIRHILDDEAYRQQIVTKFSELKAKLTLPEGQKLLAERVLSLLT